MMNAGMPMLAALASMPMPSFTPSESRAYTFLIAEFQDALSDPHFAGGLHTGTC
jgi:hypothetical protein